MKKSPKIITFYLPQYHQIPENDKWWGEGFTDWKNVVKGFPRFKGHYQPHEPAELGYYDLANENTRIAQADLAKEYGIGAFCYYHYWFNEKMLLERPLNEVLSSGKPDFPFCICWANENWTRRWDGLDNEVLIKQVYEEYDPKIHMEWLLKAFSDKRYVKIQGKPLFIIYNTSDIPDISNKLKLWRELAKKNGFPDLYICSVKSIHNKFTEDFLIELGFDALVDFIPNRDLYKYRNKWYYAKCYLLTLANRLIKLTGLSNFIKKIPTTDVYDYKKIAADFIKSPVSQYKTFNCVIPSWDNSARRKNSVVIQNEDFDLYEKWLECACNKALDNPVDEQIVFINAWNEWAEGCHLEPDLKNGRKFLEATLNVINRIS
jgi:lipopolysaccharide biosynthesis protein